MTVHDMSAVERGHQIPLIVGRASNVRYAMSLLNRKDCTTTQLPVYTVTTMLYIGCALFDTNTKVMTLYKLELNSAYENGIG